MKAIIYSIIAGLILSLMFTLTAQSEQQELCSSMVRLHILANSDSDYDQTLKLKVRDAVCNYCRENPKPTLDELVSTAQNTVFENGSDQTIKAEYGIFDFPRRTYADFTLPAGRYTGVRIILGNGEGHNWWCVMMPPLCFSQSVDGELSDEDMERLTDSLSPDAVSLISDNVQIRLKFVEWINKHINSN